jgi:hypothetical protein
MCSPVIAEVGNDEQKEEFLAPLIAGEKVGALGVTEPGAGSDVASIRTTAKKDGGDYIINGAKTYITNGAFADFITLLVRTGGEGFGGVSLVLFPTNTPGFTVGRKLDKLGTRSVDSCELHFDNCRIPQRYVLGQENIARDNRFFGNSRPSSQAQFGRYNSFIHLRTNSKRRILSMLRNNSIKCFYIFERPAHQKRIGNTLAIITKYSNLGF